MTWSRTIRQTHRWLSITFTILVVVNIVLNFVVPAPEGVVMAVGLLTLLPLALLMLTGLYLFVLPYTRPVREMSASDDHG